MAPPTKVTLQWLLDEDVCNPEACKQFFEHTGKTEFDVTAANIMMAHRSGIMSANWLAKRLLTDEEKKIFEAEQKQAMNEYEKRMAPVLARLILIRRQNAR